MSGMAEALKIAQLEERVQTLTTTLIGVQNEIREAIDGFDNGDNDEAMAILRSIVQ